MLKFYNSFCTTLNIFSKNYFLEKNKFKEINFKIIKIQISKNLDTTYEKIEY